GKGKGVLTLGQLTNNYRKAWQLGQFRDVGSEPMYMLHARYMRGTCSADMLNSGRVLRNLRIDLNRKTFCRINSTVQVKLHRHAEHMQMGSTSQLLFSA